MIYHESHQILNTISQIEYTCLGAEFTSVGYKTILLEDGDDMLDEFIHGAIVTAATVIKDLMNGGGA